MESRDEILVDKLRRGDSGAQRELYSRYCGVLMAIAVRYMASKDAAEDLLHDAFIKIFHSIKKFEYRGEGSLRAWMSRIVVNLALQELREQTRVRTTSLDQVTELLQEPMPPPEQIPREVLLQFIAELPDGYRTIFNLFCVEEYSHRQIAQMLGINEKSSSSQLLRAKRLLATKIKSYIELHDK